MTSSGHRAMPTKTVSVMTWRVDIACRGVGCHINLGRFLVRNVHARGMNLNWFQWKKNGKYSVSQKNPIHLTFDHNFSKCRPIYKILSLSDSWGNSLRNYYMVFHLTLTVLLHYFGKFKNLK